MIEENTYQIPHDTEAEQAILGSIIYSNGMLNEIAGILTPNTFHNESHRHIYRAMIELADKNQPIDEITLGDQLKSFGKMEKIGGYAYLAELVECVPSSGNIVYYAKIIQEHALLRDLIVITTDIGRKSRDPQQNISELLAEAESKITEIATRSSQKTYRHIKNILADNFIRLEEISENKNEITGLATGFTDLDRLTQGLQPSDLIIVAARPSMGKTAFATNIASHLALSSGNKGAILVFSLEMSAPQLSLRMTVATSKIDGKKMRSGNLETEDWDKLAISTDRLSVAPVYIDDRPNLTPYEIVTTSKQLDKSLENGVSLIIVDYMQLMRGNKRTQSREQEISEISRSMKGLAKDLDIPVMALSQLNRALENRSDKRPQLSDLRESGAIEQDADIILFIYRDEVYNEDTKNKGIAEIIIGKHRNGPTGLVRLAFQGQYTKFSNLAHGNPKHWND